MAGFKLDNHPKIEDGFSTPENYFNEVENRIMQRIQEPATRVIPIYRRTIVWAAAAVIVIALGIFSVWNLKQTPETDNVENYLASVEFTQEELIALLDDNDIEQLTADLKLDPQEIENVLADTPYLEQYILN